MSLKLRGHVEVEFFVPKTDANGKPVLDAKGVPQFKRAKHRFKGADFGWEDGEGVGRDDEGSVYFSGHMKASHDDLEVALYIFVYERQQAQKYNLTSSGCEIVNDALTYDF